MFLKLCVLLLLGVSGVYTDEVSLSVMEGDSLTLLTDVKIKEKDRIRWYCNGTRIAQINGDLRKTCTDVQCNEGTETFIGRLKLDHQTGSLTITNTRTEDSGEYKLQIISNSSERIKIFSVSVIDAAAEIKELKAMSPKEGESVTLDPAGRNPNDVMAWYYNDVLIAEITGDQSQICTDDQCKERFRDRLKLDHQTGALTIMNTKTSDSGLYKLQINRSGSRFSIRRIKSFSVSVTVAGSGLSPGAIAGISVGVVLLFVAVAAAIYSRKKRLPTYQSPTQEVPQSKTANDSYLTVTETAT